MPLVTEKFGIEIEHVFGRGCTYDKILDELRDEGLGFVDGRDSHIGSDPRKWTLKRDGSLPDNAGELVSPPLNFEDPAAREQVNRAVRCLQRAGARPDVTAGIHVHIGCEDFNAIQIAAVCRFFYKFEDVMYRLASSGWLRIRPQAVYSGSRYARPLGVEMIRKMTKVRDMNALRDAWAAHDESLWSEENEGSRYHAVNLESWWMRGTVEFRVFNSSLNPERLQAYIAICAAIIRDARHGKRTGRSTNKNYPLGTMMSNPLPERVKENDWRQHSSFVRFQQVMRYEAGMTKEDWKRVLMCWKDSVPQNAILAVV